MNTSNNVEVIKIFHEKIFDLESFMDDIYDIPDTKNVNINHVLQVRKESEHVFYNEEFHGEEEFKYNYKNYNAYSGAQKKRRIRNIYKHLNQLDEPKIGVERRVILTKFRCFVISEDQYYWMYQDLLEEDFKLSQLTSSKERKYGNLQLPKSNDDNNSADQ